MSLAEIKENRIIAKQLSRLLISGKTVHAFLFVGSGEQTLELGKEFAKALLCGQDNGDSCGICRSCIKFDHGNHEDLIFLERTENRQSIVVSQIEELQGKLSYKSLGSKRAVIIKDAHLMNASSQNKLLKTLEEPSPGTVIILLAENKDMLLPTIISRCSSYYLSGEENKPSPQAADLAEVFAGLCLKDAPFYKRRDCLKTILSSKDDARGSALEFLTALEEELRKRLLAGEDTEKITKAIRLAEEAGKNIRMSFNTAYVLKGLCLNI